MDPNKYSLSFDRRSLKAIGIVGLVCSVFAVSVISNNLNYYSGLSLKDRLERAVERFYSSSKVENHSGR